MLKRTIDITLSLILLILTMPLLLLVALLIKLSDRGPVLFWQTRIGQNGCPFKLMKFRSMAINAEKVQAVYRGRNIHADNLTFKMKRDPRITWIGKHLRRWSIDEMPQLVNVLKGEMSMVGPRPPLPHEVKHYGPYEKKRLEVKPGLTCLWQISGRSDLPFAIQVKLDRRYVETRNLLLDFKILLKTLPVILLGKGAY